VEVTVAVAVEVAVEEAVDVAVCVGVPVVVPVTVFVAVPVGVKVKVLVAVCVEVTTGVEVMVNVDVESTGSVGTDVLALQPAIKTAASNPMALKLPISFFNLNSPELFLNTTLAMGSRTGCKASSVP
jgi:hypothetical protein